MFKPAGSNGSREGRKQVPEAGWNFHHKSLTAMRPGFLFPGPGLSAGEGGRRGGRKYKKQDSAGNLSSLPESCFCFTARGIAASRNVYVVRHAAAYFSVPASAC